MTTIILNRDELLARLEERRPLFEKLDKDRLAKHQADEKAHVANFKKACQIAAKWSYQEAKARSFSLPTPEEIRGEPRYGRYSSGWSNGPTCPRSELSQLDRVITALKHSSQKKYTLSSNTGTAHYEAYRFLTYDPDATPDTLC